jgi:hypothetical protein
VKIFKLAKKLIRIFSIRLKFQSFFKTIKKAHCGPLLMAFVPYKNMISFFACRQKKFPPGNQAVFAFRIAISFEPTCFFVKNIKTQENFKNNTTNINFPKLQKSLIHKMFSNPQKSIKIPKTQKTYHIVLPRPTTQTSTK